MAVPQNKKTSSKRNMRRSHDALKRDRRPLSVPNCGELKLPASCLRLHAAITVISEVVVAWSDDIDLDEDDGVSA